MAALYPFTEAEFQAASRTWGANCGPAALAFALHKRIDEVRPAIPDFEIKGYTSPTMMKAGLQYFRASWRVINPCPNPPFEDDGGMSLVRVQFTGPWTAAGSNPRWAYGHTHWIASYMTDHGRQLVFDCNGGVMEWNRWEREILPLLTGMHKRSDGGWYPTHVWTIDDRSIAPRSGGQS